MNSDDDTPLDSLFSNNTAVEPETKLIKLGDNYFAIQTDKIKFIDLSTDNQALLKDKIKYDSTKYSLEISNSILIQLVNTSNTENGENKENEPILENGVTATDDEPENIENTEIEISSVEHQNFGTNFEIEEITTMDTVQSTIDQSPQKELEKSPTKKPIDNGLDSADDTEIQILDKPETIEAFWYLEHGLVQVSKDVPTQFKSRDGNSPQLDCSVGGLYYKIYAEGHERRMAAQVVIKPSYITHRRLYLAEEARNYPDPAQFMAAVKETYLEKMINENEDLSFQNFCGQCFRCFNSPFDLQVHKELVHQTQHAATCRICEFNFGDPSYLLKHMAAVHSSENAPNSLLGAYRCLICRFCSPLYSELLRHYTEYHSRSGWLLCPLCLRVFSSDTSYEQHMAHHITKGKYFRCQSCRLIFETEQHRARHEIEMHGRQKWVVPDSHPKIPLNVKVWVRGEIDPRSKVSCDDLNVTQACRALCLNDCTDPLNNLKSHEKSAKTSSRIVLVPKNQLIAPKAFREEILSGKTRSQRRDVEHERDSEVVEIKVALESKMKDSILNQMSELYFLMGEKSDESEMLKVESKKPVETSLLDTLMITAQNEEKMKEEKILKDEKIENDDSESDESGVFNKSDDYETEPEDFKAQSCIECKTQLTSFRQLNEHYTQAPLKYFRGNLETYCSIALEQYKRRFVNGPSLQPYDIKDSWLKIGKNLLKSYPKGAMCVCGKSDPDFGNVNGMAKHLAQNPSHHIKIHESLGHSENVKNKIHSQRIRRLIQSGPKLLEVERCVDDTPLSVVNQLAEEKPFAEKEVSPEDNILQKLGKLFKLKPRKTATIENDTNFMLEPTNRRRFKVSASGVDLEGNIISRESILTPISRKDERMIISVLHKTNVERQARVQQISQQQRLQQHVLQHLRIENDRRQNTPNVRIQQNVQMYSNQNQTRNNDVGQVSRMVNVSSGQKRPGAPLASPMQKMKTTVHYRKVLPVTPADVKFPVVTHKEIQVEIVPSEDARINNNIDKYEIEFKGRKTPNKYSVKPNIKIVKLIGLQSDTEYLIKVYAIRNKTQSIPILKRVKTMPLPRGVNVGVVSDVIELD